jgi:hypothetical protein
LTDAKRTETEIESEIKTKQEQALYTKYTAKQEIK